MAPRQLSERTNDLRAWGAKTVPCKIRLVTVARDGEERTFGVRAPTAAERVRIAEAGGLRKSGDSPTLAQGFALKLAAICTCIVEPETREAVWRLPEDKATLEPELVAGSWLDKLGDAALSAGKGLDRATCGAELPGEKAGETKPCPQSMETEWKFCPACGAPAKPTTLEEVAEKN